MIFSKSFGYALRGILYIAIQGKTGRNIQLDEIAEKLNIPRYFLGKVLKKVAKSGFLNSTKGHSGGFSINEKTLNTPLVDIAALLGELSESGKCALRFKSCNANNPCPLHYQVEPIKGQWTALLLTTRIDDLLDSDSEEFLSSIISTWS
jgi:Rrf2 family protein